MAGKRARTRRTDSLGPPATKAREKRSAVKTGTWYEDLLRTPDGRKISERERVLVEATMNLAALMEAEGVNGAELARRLRVSPARISQMLDGTRNLTLASLAEAFHALGRSLHVTHGPPTDEVRLLEARKRARARRPR